MDIVTRLRKAQQTFYGDTSINELHMYAADEIERLLETLHKERKLRNHALELAIDLQKEVDRLNGYSWSVAAAIQQKKSE